MRRPARYSRQPARISTTPPTASTVPSDELRRDLDVAQQQRAQATVDQRIGGVERRHHDHRPVAERRVEQKRADAVADAVEREPQPAGHRRPRQEPAGADALDRSTVSVEKM